MAMKIFDAMILMIRLRLSQDMRRYFIGFLYAALDNIFHYYTITRLRRNTLPCQFHFISRARRRAS